MTKYQIPESQIPESVLKSLDENIEYLEGLKKAVEKSVRYPVSVGISAKATRSREKWLPGIRQALPESFIALSMDATMATIGFLGLDKPAMVPMIVGYGKDANVSDLREAALSYDRGYYGFTAQSKGGFLTLSLEYVSLEELKKAKSKASVRP